MAFDRTNSTHRQELAYELRGNPDAVPPTVADPAGVGYQPELNEGSYTDVARMQNDVDHYAGTIDRAVIAPEEFQCGVVAREWQALAQREFDMWSDLLGLGQIPVRDPNLRQQVRAIWPARPDPDPDPEAQNTLENLAALQRRPGTRAEEIWGDGSLTTADDIRQAERWWQATHGTGASR